MNRNLIIVLAAATTLFTSGLYADSPDKSGKTDKKNNQIYNQLAKNASDNTSHSKHGHHHHHNTKGKTHTHHSNKSKS